MKKAFKVADIVKGMVFKSVKLGHEITVITNVSKNGISFHGTYLDGDDMCEMSFDAAKVAEYINDGRHIIISHPLHLNSNGQRTQTDNFVVTINNGICFQIEMKSDGELIPVVFIGGAAIDFYATSLYFEHFKELTDLITDYI